MRLIDLQVSFQALPEQARQQGMEMASTMYRQVQDLARNRAENLARPERVQQAVQVSSSGLQALDPRENRRGIPAVREERRERDLPVAFLYSPRGKTEAVAGVRGRNLDLYA